MLYCIFVFLLLVLLTKNINKDEKCNNKRNCLVDLCPQIYIWLDGERFLSKGSEKMAGLLGQPQFSKRINLSEMVLFID